MTLQYLFNTFRHWFLDRYGTVAGGPVSPPLPRCPRCFEPLGSCIHDPDDPWRTP